MDKAALRTLSAAWRATAHAADPEAGDRLVDAFPPWHIPPPESVVSGYWPIRSEIDPRPLMRFLRAKNCRLALPVTPPKGSDQPLGFRLWDESEALIPGAFGLSTPMEDAPLVDPDLLLCPLLAFDRFGGRLGYGAGHYDRTLAALVRKKPTVALGLAYAAQEVERTPTDAHDAPLDGIVTERAYIEAMRILP